MIAVDTNILVYAHRADSNWYEKADAWLTQLAESGQDWAIPWPCIHEFLAIVSHPRIYRPPTPLDDAIVQVECWLECPTLTVIGETDTHWPCLKSVLTQGKVAGPAIHDVRIAAICLQHGVDALFTADRDFSRITGLTVKNPLIN